MRAIHEAVARGALDDDVFDRILLPRWQVRSAVHWTPVEVARLAIAWLTARGARRVLDVGAGVGKLCVLGALLSPDATFVGIERRPALAHEARRIAALLGLSERVQIHEGLLDSIEGADFDAFYLYNPFAEGLIDDLDDRIDDDVVTGLEPFARDVRIVEGWLRGARDGTRLVTLHGFGGEVPPSYYRVARLPVGLDELAAWEQVCEAPALARSATEPPR